MIDAVPTILSIANTLLIPDSHTDQQGAFCGLPVGQVEATVTRRADVLRLTRCHVSELSELISTDQLAGLKTGQGFSRIATLRR
ncbi:hypothetical protein BJF85_13190 [Saccharomonospora sp. CUA-673]|nr:hypothetical protein BJF85_13190 [Saccharomonospora sp. CUA-673]